MFDIIMGHFPSRRQPHRNVRRLSHPVSQHWRRVLGPCVSWTHPSISSRSRRLTIPLSLGLCMLCSGCVRPFYNSSFEAAGGERSKTAQIADVALDGGVQTQDVRNRRLTFLHIFKI